MASRQHPDEPDDEGLAPLLAQVGSQAASCFADAIAPLGLEARHVGVLRCLAGRQGQSQQALGEVLGLNPTRMVFLVDDLEQLGLVERRRNPDDRRSYALHITAKGRKVLDHVKAAARQSDARLCASLTPSERDELARLLKALAANEELPETL